MHPNVVGKSCLQRLLQATLVYIQENNVGDIICVPCDVFTDTYHVVRVKTPPFGVRQLQLEDVNRS